MRFIPEIVQTMKPWQITLWLIVYGAALLWSGITPKDRFTWWLEVLPALAGLAALVLAWRSFRFTPLVSWLILAHCLVLIVGGHYTYAEVPLFDQLSAWLGGTRNNYDKLGHFVQGFIPAMIAREIIIRRHIILQPRWRAFFIVCFCLAFSAFYELVEWMMAVATGKSAEAFLGTQGYVWDTQTDMALALIGSILALILLVQAHDRQLEAVEHHRE